REGEVLDRMQLPPADAKEAAADRKAHRQLFDLQDGIGGTGGHRCRSHSSQHFERWSPSCPTIGGVRVRQKSKLEGQRGSNGQAAGSSGRSLTVPRIGV